MSTDVVPEGLSPGPDGTFYGTYSHVPVGWEWTRFAAACSITKERDDYAPDVIVWCWPPKPKWVADGNVVKQDGSLIHCYRPDRRPGGLPGLGFDPELAERVARLLNEDG